MSTLLIILIILGALLTAGLVLGEIFFIPGVGLLGIIGVLTFIGVEGYFIYSPQLTFAILYGGVALLAFVIGFYLLSRNKFMKKVALTDTVDEVAVKLPSEVSKGGYAEAVSRLALVGTIRLDGSGTLVEAESEEGFIDERERVYISDIRGNKVFVKRLL